MAEREFQRITNLLRQRSIGITGKDLDVVVQWNSTPGSQTKDILGCFEARRIEETMAGAGGFEPPNAGSKDLCLTA